MNLRKFKEVLLSKTILTNTISVLQGILQLPILESINVFNELLKIIKRIENYEEAVFVALFWTSQKSLVEVFEEIGLTDEKFEKLPEKQKEKILKVIRNYKKEFEELGKKIKNNEIDDELKEKLENFYPYNFYENEIVKDFENIIFRYFKEDEESLNTFNELRGKEIIEVAGLDNFKGIFRKRFERNFWYVVEDDENKFKVILTNLESRAKLQDLKRYKIEKYYKEILRRYEEEPIFDDERNITLKDTYIEPFYRVYENCITDKSIDEFERDYKISVERKERNDFFLKPKNDESILEVIKNFIEGKEDERFKAYNPKILIILGYPGEGKSSLSKKIIYDFKKNEFNTDKSIYLLELRRLDKEIVSNFSMEKLEEELNRIIFGRKIKGEFTTPDFENSILVLDGLDEILMQERFLTDETEKFIESLLWYIKNKNEFKNIKIIITSRYGYINLEKLYPKNLNNILTVELKEFTKEQQIKWLKRYINFYPEKEDYLKQFKDLPSHIEELISQPILLYMIVSANIKLNELIKESKSYIYDKLFDFVIARKWSELKEHPNIKNLAKEDLRNFLREIAFFIFKSKSEYIHSSQIYKLDIFTNYLTSFDIEKDKNNLKNLSKGLFVAFYLREVELEMGDEKELKEKGFPAFAVEFLHKSLQEYLTAEYIFYEFLRIGEKDKRKRYIKSLNEVLNLIWNLFSDKKLTLEIRKYLEEIIEEKREKYKKEINSIFLRVTDIYRELFSKSFIVKIDSIQTEYGIYKPLYTFGNLWVFLKLLFNKEKNLLDKVKIDKNRFIEFLKLIQSNNVSFVENLPLYSENLKNLDLSRINLRKSILYNSNLVNTNFFETNLSRANLKNSNLQSSNLSRANLIRANLSHCNLILAKLIKSDLEEGNLSFSNLHQSNLEGANLKNANLKNTILIDSNIIYVNFKYVKNVEMAVIDEANKKYLEDTWGFKFD